MPRLRLRLRALFRGELIHDVLTDPPAPPSPIELIVFPPPPVESPSPEQNSSPSPSPSPSPPPHSPSPHSNSYLYLAPHHKPVAIDPTYDPYFLHGNSPPLLHHLPNASIPQETPSAPLHPRANDDGLITPHAVFRQLLLSQQPITEGEWVAMGKARERERKRRIGTVVSPSPRFVRNRHVEKWVEMMEKDREKDMGAEDRLGAEARTLRASISFALDVETEMQMEMRTRVRG
ncbi:MAG: hypothetical protein Q9208_006124 [Pyrenodesmia sp. 3 TL-2023]